MRAGKVSALTDSYEKNIDLFIPLLKAGFVNESDAK